MITINKKYQVSYAGNGTLTYIATSDTCITIVNPTGTITDGTIELELTLADQDCSGDIVINVTESECNRVYSITSTIASPCTNFEASISSNELVFTALPLNGTAPYTYDWTYNTQTFNEQSSGEDGVLELVYSNNNISSNVSVTITDANGCTATASEIITLCEPTIRDMYSNTSCLEGNPDYFVTSTLITIDQLTNCTLDYSTLDINFPDANWTLVNNNDGTFFIYAKNSLVEQEYTFTSSIVTTQGIRSNLANVVINYEECLISGILEVDNFSFTLPNNYGASYVVGNNIQSTQAIDPATFQWQPITGQTAIGNTITGVYGSATLVGNKTIQYTPNASTHSAVDESFSFQVESLVGSFLSNVGTFTYIYPNTTPQGTLVSDTGCLSDTNVTVDLLANATGSIDSSTFEELSSTGSISYLGTPNGVYTFLTDPNQAIDTTIITYQVKDTIGNTLPQATYTITATPHGSVDLGIFNSTTVNLVPYTPTTQDPGNPAVLNLATVNAVAIPTDGTYTVFENYNVSGCTSQRSITFQTVNPTIAAASVLIDTDATQDGRFDITLTAGLNNVALNNGQEITVRAIRNGVTLASANLIVGNDLTGTNNDTNWGTNFAPYFDLVTLDGTTLQTGQVLSFRKRTWALDNGYAGVNEGQDLTFEFEYTVDGVNSGTANTTLSKVYEGQFYQPTVNTSSASGAFLYCQAEGSTTSKSGGIFRKDLFDASTLQIFDGTQWINSTGFANGVAGNVANNMYTDHPTDTTLSTVCLDDTSEIEPAGIRLNTTNSSDVVANIAGVTLTAKGIVSDVRTVVSRTSINAFVQTSNTFNVTLEESFLHLHNVSNAVIGEPDISDDCPLNMTSATIYIANASGLNQDPKLGTVVNSQVPPDARFNSAGTIVGNIGNVGNTYTNMSNYTFPSEGVFKVRSEFVRGNDYNCPGGDCNTIDWDIALGNCSGDAGTGADVDPNEPTSYQEALYVIGSY